MVRVVFAGTPQIAVPSLQLLLESGYEVAAVLTRPDAPAGRGRRLTPSPVAQHAEQAGIPVLKPKRLGDLEFLTTLREIAPDVVAVVAYGALVPPSALEIPAHGWVNLHFSLLPAWRGAAPVQHAILHGDEITGATTFLLEPELDTGPILGVVTEPIRPRDTAGELLDRLSHSGARLLVATVEGLVKGVLEPRPQPAEGISYAPKLTPDDARIDWTKPAVHVDRLIRACTPEPGAWTTLDGRRLKLGPVDVVPPESAEGAVVLSPGELHADRHRVLVGTATTPVQLGWVQPPGKPPIPAADWARGARLGPAPRFT